MSPRSALPRDAFDAGDLRLRRLCLPPHRPCLALFRALLRFLPADRDDPRLRQFPDGRVSGSGLSDDAGGAISSSANVRSGVLSRVHECSVSAGKLQSVYHAFLLAFGGHFRRETSLIFADGNTLLASHVLAVGHVTRHSYAPICLDHRDGRGFSRPRGRARLSLGRHHPGLYLSRSARLSPTAYSFRAGYRAGRLHAARHAHAPVLTPCHFGGTLVGCHRTRPKR